jgi:four helix bundle protein
MSQQLKDRTKAFADNVIRFGATFPQNAATDIIWRQLLRSALSIGANYRAACCARSGAEFISKLHVTREEADETQYWLELLMESAGMRDRALADLLQEARELTAIFTVSLVTAKRNSRIKHS